MTPLPLGTIVQGAALEEPFRQLEPIRVHSGYAAVRLAKKGFDVEFQGCRQDRWQMERLLRQEPAEVVLRISNR
ncbi:MAG: hypothetical protein KGL39_06860 [Patescibacteria group bacterium]|nr:hypothetical protein [Patescibacteria group bacterium]